MKVKSSTISEIDRKEVKGQTFMKIVFTNGREYLYEGVDDQTYNEFLNSESKGKYFHQHINGRYKYSRV